MTKPASVTSATSATDGGQFRSTRKSRRIVLTVHIVAAGAWIGVDVNWRFWYSPGGSATTARCAASLTATAAGSFALVATLLAVGATSSLVVTGIEGVAASWPPAAEVLTDLAAGWLIGFMWAALGVALFVGLRAVASRSA
jgi:hypothetical protein